MRLWRTSFILFFIACSVHASDGEVIPKDEDQNIAKIVQLIESPTNVLKKAPGQVYGCATGTFSIVNGLPPKLAQGLFKDGRTSYYAEVRFEDSSLRRENDHLPNLQGMSIKLHEVAGTKLISDPRSADVQDFILSSSPTFFVANVADFLNFEIAYHSPPLSGMAWWNLYRKMGSFNLTSAAAASEVAISNPLNAQYWSQVPIKYGDTQAKFSVEKCVGSRFHDESTGPDHLRENLAAHFRQNSACFDFKVQLRTNEATQPIENAAVIWREDEAPFVTVARLWMNPQEVRSGADCQNLSFTSWNGLLEHRPLGGISRLRKAVHRGVDSLRGNLVGVPDSGL